MIKEEPETQNNLINRLRYSPDHGLRLSLDVYLLRRYMRMCGSRSVFSWSSVRSLHTACWTKCSQGT